MPSTKTTALDDVMVHVKRGLWLLPFGYLGFKSSILPRILGVLLMIGCLADVFDVLGRALFSDYANTVLASLATYPGSVGEIGICLWLLIMGAREGNLSRA